MDAKAKRRESTRRAVTAAVEVARGHGVRVEEPVVLNDLFSVMVHLRPAPVVARVPTWVSRLRAPMEEVLEREVAVTTYLAEQGAPVVPPSPELPAGPHRADGLVMSFLSYAEPDPDRTVAAADCSAMLAELHAALDSYPGALPKLTDGVVAMVRWLELLADRPDLVTAAELDRLHAAADRLAPMFAADENAMALHGDAHPGNIVATRGGLLWIDFEDVCVGPAEWDLASMGDPDAVAMHHRPDPELMARCGELRAFQVTMCLLGLRDVFGDTDGWEDGIGWGLGAMAGG